MFEEVSALWQQYQRRSAWSADDVRVQLAAEVENRLGQLDLILSHLDQALAVVRPQISSVDLEAFALEAERFRTGEVTDEDYEAKLRDMLSVRPPSSFQSWNEVRLFTEMFYFVAWRICEVVNASGPRAFSLPRVNAVGVRDVRNRLLEHPERDRTGANYSQTLMVTDDGPVLKTMAFRVLAGRSGPVSDSLDRGLFRNAEELAEKLTVSLQSALS